MRKDCVRLFNIFVVLFACAVCTPYNNGKKTITNNNNNDIYLCGAWQAPRKHVNVFIRVRHKYI